FGQCLGAPTVFPASVAAEMGIPYTISAADATAGSITITGKYVDFRRHTGTTDQTTGGLLTIPQTIPVTTCTKINTGCEQAGCDPNPAFPGCFDNKETCTKVHTGCEQADCDPNLAFPGCFDNKETCTKIHTGCEQADCDPNLAFPGCFDNTATC